MSTQIAELVTAFTAQTTELDRAFSSLDKKFNVFEQVATGAVRRVGELITDGIGKAFETVGDIAQAGIDFNSMQEQAETAFTTMLGSAEKAQSFLDEMQAFAKKTPFEYPDLLVASRRLMALGFSADEVLPTLENIGNAVAAMGGNQQMIDRVTTALGQMKAKGKVQAEEMMQLSENGIAGWDMLAKYLNVDVATAMDMVTKRQVDASTGIAAIQAGISERFGGMMEKQSTSWAGMISNLKDSFGMLSGQVMKPVFDVLKTGLEWLVNFTSSDKFTKGVADFADGLAKNIAWAGDAIERFTSLFGLQLSILTSDNSSWGERLIAVWDMVYGVGLKLFTSLADSLGKLLPQWLENLGEWATALWDWIVESTPKALEKLIEWGGELLGWVGDNLPTWLSNLWEWGKGLWAWIVEVTPIAIQKLGELGLALVQGITEWAFGMGPEVSALWNIIVNIFTAAYGLVTGQWDIFWSNLGNIVTNFNQGILPTLQALGTAIWTWIADNAPTALTKLGEWGSGLINYLAEKSPIWQQKLGEMGTAAWNWLAEAIPIVFEKINEWGGAIFGWFAENLPTFINTMLGWGTAIVKWIGEAAPKAINALSSFIAGLRGEGDGNGANGIGQMVAGWATRLWNWITLDALPKIAPAFMEFIGAVTTAGSGIAAAVGGLVWELGTLLWEWIVTATPIALTKLGEWGGILWAWVSSNAPIWAEKLGQWATLAWRWIVDAWPVVQQKLGEWAGNIWAWVKARAPEWATKLGEWATVIWGWVTLNAPKWGEKLMEWAGYAWDWLTGDGGAVSMAADKLGEWATAIYDWVTDPANVEKWTGELATWGGEIWGWIEDAFPETTTAMEGWWGEIKAKLDEYQPLLSNYMTTWQQIVATLFGTDTQTNTTQTWGEWWDTLWIRMQEADTQTQLMSLEWEKSLWEWIGTAIPKAIRAFGDYIRDAIGGMKPSSANGGTAAIDAMQKELEDAIGAALDEVGWALLVVGQDIGWAILDGIWNGLTGQERVTKTERAVEQLDERLKQQMIDDFGIHSPSTVFAGYGDNVVAGFAQGFDDRWDRFRTSTSTTVTSWTNWFKNIFGIHSPSTVFAEHGANIVAGLAKGISGASGMVYDAMGQLSSGMNTTMSADYAYAGASSPTVETNPNARMEQLLTALLLELRGKNMSPTVSINGGGDGLGALVTYATAGRGY